MENHRETVPLSIAWVRSERTLRLCLAGELDLAMAAHLRSALATPLLTPEITAVVLDLDRLTFMDCAGLDALILAKRQLTRAGMAATVVNPHGTPLRVLRLTGVDRELMNTSAPPEPQSVRPGRLRKPVGRATPSATAGDATRGDRPAGPEDVRRNAHNARHGAACEAGR